MGADIVNLANVLSTQTAAIAPDAQAKQVLKEAVDAVVNSFAKHTQGYGRGKCAIHFYCYYSLSLRPPPHVRFILIFRCIFYSSFAHRSFVPHWRRILSTFIYCAEYTVCYFYLF